MCRFIVDTNVLLLDYRVLSEKFPGKDLIIPDVVLQELDKKKNEAGPVGFNARRCLQFIESLTNGSDKILYDGVKREQEGGKLFISTKFIESQKFLSNDEIIVQIALKYKSDKDHTYKVLTCDKYVKILCSLNNIESFEYENGRDKLKFHRNIELKQEDVEQLLIDRRIPAEKYTGFYVNEYFYIANDIEDLDQPLIAQYTDGLDPEITLIRSERSVFDINSKNLEQDFLIDSILNFPVTICIGNTGSGKTLIALASTLQVFEDNAHKKYNRILLLKPLSIVGKDIGYLPGNKDEKIEPFFLSYEDNLNYIGIDRDFSKHFRYIEYETLTHMRGRSLNNYIIILDEAQNITKLEMKTLVSRIGYDSKLIILGDITQIDEHYLNIHNNGLSIVNDKFQGKPEVSCVYLSRTERSRISELSKEL